MYIIDKNKDFYDYLSHIYGQDKKATYDRRGSVVLDDKKLIEGWIGHRYRVSEGSHILLEIGNIQHILYVDEVEYTDSLYREFVSCKLNLVHTIREHKHQFDTPMSIREVNIHSVIDVNYPQNRRYVYAKTFSETVNRIYDGTIEHPILKGTQLTSFLDPQEVWIELQNYILSLKNEEDTSTPMTEEEKAETHGFDRKTSFRNPIR